MDISTGGICYLVSDSVEDTSLTVLFMFLSFGLMTKTESVSRTVLSAADASQCKLLTKTILLKKKKKTNGGSLSTQD